jgi:cellulose synthase/poly-beta-1,6-N-acetylglucosamine synthase-like glycosyltransferase
MISVIITSYKEPKTIGKAIESILKLRPPIEYELLITAPDKETLDVARKYSQKNKNIKLIQDQGKGKPAALHKVFQIAKSDILVLTDGEVFTENWVELLKYFDDEKVGAVSGHPISTNPKEKMIGYWSHFLFDIAHKLREKRQEQERFILCSGYLFAFRKKIIGKLPEDILDDAYISREIWAKDYKIKYEKNAKVYVKSPTNFKDWLKQKKRNAYGEFQLKRYKGKSMRSFRDEIEFGFFRTLAYPKTIKEFSWIISLLLARLYAWILSFVNRKIKKKSMKDLWQRVESTK